MESKPVYFYVNSIGPCGLFSLCGKCAEESSGTRTYFVKGAPGECSGFIENICRNLEREGLFVQRFRSFYSSEELDGAYIPEVDVYIFDGNRADFRMPMVDCCQYIVELGSCCNRKENFLNRALITHSMCEEKKYISKAVNFLSTVKSVCRDTARLSGDAINAEKAERFVGRFIKRELGTFSSYKGREYFRILSGITPTGIFLPENTLVKMCPKLYCIDDKTGAVSGLIVSQIRESALMCGFDVVSLLSPFTDSGAEHIIVPEIGVGIITSNSLNPYCGDCFKKISSSRFVDSEKMKKHRSRIKFNLTAQSEMMNQAFYLLSEAKKYRDEYFEIYSRSADREKINSLAEETTREILSFISCT